MANSVAFSTTSGYFCSSIGTMSLLRSTHARRARKSAGNDGGFARVKLSSQAGLLADQLLLYLPSGNDPRRLPLARRDGGADASGMAGGHDDRHHAVRGVRLVRAG